MSVRPIEADFPGSCPECGDDIAPGDIIRMTDEGAVHDDCYIDPDGLVLL